MTSPPRDRLLKVLGALKRGDDAKGWQRELAHQHGPSCERRHRADDGNNAAAFAESGVLVRIQEERLNGSFDLTNPKTLRWVTQLRADPAYQNAVDVIASASTQNDAWRAAARFIESDDFVRAVYVAAPRARHDVPPP